MIFDIETFMMKVNFSHILTEARSDSVAASEIKNFLEPAMFCHLAVLIYLCGDRGKVKDRVYAKQKESKNFFTQISK
jgi:hypothetical protein